MEMTIPLKEVIAKCMKEPGFAEAREQARRELDEEIAIYGTIGNPKPQPRPVFARASTKRKPRGSAASGFSARPNSARAMA